MLSGQQYSTEVISGLRHGRSVLDLATASTPIKVVVGYEWRAAKTSSAPSDTVFAEGQLLGQGGPTPSLIGGKYNVTEFFGEANIPVLDSLVC